MINPNVIIQPIIEYNNEEPEGPTWAPRANCNKGKEYALVTHKDGQIVFRPSCPMDNQSPQCGCPALILKGISVSLQLHTRKIQLPTGQPRFPLVAQ